MTNNEQILGSKIDRQVALLEARLPQIVITILLIGLGMGLTYYILTSDSNPIAETMVVLGPFSMILGVIYPKFGFKVLIIACAYLDLIKRIAYSFGYYGAANQGVGTLQVSILSFAPITLVGIFLGVIVRRVFVTKRLIERTEFFVVAFISLAILLIIIKGYRGDKDLLAAFSKSANEGIYLLLIFIVPALFTTRDDIVKVLRFIFIAFLPCAFYGIWQGFFGYTQLDIMWMNSGITITESLLYDVRARAFGTLASPHPYAVLYWIAIMGCYLAYISKRGRSLYVTATLIYLLALYFGFARGAWVSYIVTFGAIYFFSGKGKTLVFYLSAITTFVLFVSYAQFILDHLGDFESVLPISSSGSEMAFRLGTFSDRLFSIQNWTTDTRLWSWFGRADLANAKVVDYNTITHDMLGEMLVRYGGVGMISAVVFATAGLIYFHRSTLQIPDPKDRFLATTILALISVTLFCGSIAGSSYEVFPWNFFIWFAVGAQISLCRLRFPAPASKKAITENFTRRASAPRRVAFGNLSGASPMLGRRSS